MQFQFSNKDKNYSFESMQYFDISIPMKFDGEQPNTYNVPIATASPYKDGTFIGDTRLGGSCNFQSISIVPHCNGTHTECIGHISNERVYIAETLKDAMFNAKLISVEIDTINSSKESYRPELNLSDKLITKLKIESALQQTNYDFNFDTLIIRTIPNHDSKKSQNYLKDEPAFLTIEAIQYINEIGINHLILDVPSLDRTFDDGLLTCHHIYWNVQEETNNLSPNSSNFKTITEMAYISNEICDGNYLINIQIANFESDASPSRILLFPIILL